MSSPRQPAPVEPCPRCQWPRGRWMPFTSAGVMDPAKVVRSALQHAASIASLLLTTEAVITQIPEKNKNAAMPGGGMGAGMY